MTSAGTDLREQAGRLGAVARLLDVRLVSCVFDLEDPTPAGPAEVEVDFRVTSQRSDELLAYVVTGEVKGAIQEHRSTIFTTEAAFVVVFEIPPDLPTADDEVEAFGQITALPTAYPYMRALVQDMTGKAGLPPLVLEVLRIPLSGTPSQPT